MTSIIGTLRRGFRPRGSPPRPSPPFDRGSSMASSLPPACGRGRARPDARGRRHGGARAPMKRGPPPRPHRPENRRPEPPATVLELRVLLAADARRQGRWDRVRRPDGALEPLHDLLGQLPRDAVDRGPVERLVEAPLRVLRAV